MAQASTSIAEPSKATDSHPVSANHRLVSIDALRGLAALAVVLTHIPRQGHGEFDWLFLSFLPLDFGALGVPLFIVLSGFCIHLGVARRAAAGGNPEIDWLEFWKRRFVRLYPPYVAAIIFSLLAYSLLTVSGRLPEGSTLGSLWTDLAVHAVMLQNVTPLFAAGLFNPALWTLALEEQLYGLFAVVLVLRRRISAVKILWIALSVSLGWKLVGIWTTFALVRFFGVPRELHVVALGNLPVIGNWSNWVFAWWFLWVLGAVAAEAHAGAIRLPRWCYNRIVAVCAAAVCFPTYFRTLGVYTTYYLNDLGATGWLRVSLESIGVVAEPAFSVACFIVLNRWCRAEREGRFAGWWVGPISWCGAMSYSLYLVHFPTIRVLEAFVPIGDRQSLLDAPVRILIYVPICVAIGFAFFLGVERRFLNRSRVRGRSASASPAYQMVGAAHKSPTPDPRLV